MFFSEKIAEYIRSGESMSKKLGLEIEHFIIDEQGMQMEFHEISALIDRVGHSIGAEMIYMDGYTVGYATPEYATSLEPACQFEISISPYSSIEEIGRVYQEFRILWDPIFAERGYHFETKGNLPLVETGEITPDEIPLSPKKRYEYMDKYFQESGRFGRYMMRASASTQVSIDYSSEADMVRKLRILEKLSPVFMMMMENKTSEDSTLPGAEDKPHLFRIQEWDDLDPDRTGFVPHSFETDFGYAKMADVVCHTPLILLTDEGETAWVGHQNAADLVENGTIREEELTEERERHLMEHFMSMGFFHFRVKKYIEIRVADSVPIEKALGYAALIKGIVYSDANLATLERILRNISGPEQIQEAVQSIMRFGWSAVIYNKGTVSEWAGYLLALAGNVLPEKERGYLENVRIIRRDSEQENIYQSIA